MSVMRFTAEQRDCLERAAYLELENVSPNLEQFILARKKFIQESKRTKDEHRFNDCMRGINFCNSEMKKILSIPTTELD